MTCLHQQQPSQALSYALQRLVGSLRSSTGMRACHVLSRNEDFAGAVPVRHVLMLSPLHLTPASPATQVSTHASVDATEAAATVRELEIGRLRSLCARLRDAPTLSHKVPPPSLHLAHPADPDCAQLAVLDSVPDVRKALSTCVFDNSCV